MAYTLKCFIPKSDSTEGEIGYKDRNSSLIFEVENLFIK